MSKAFFLFSIVILTLFATGQGLGQTGLFANLNLIDEGQYAAWVNNMLYAKVMYKDTYIQYGPLSVFPIYILMVLFGESFFFVRFWNLLQAAIAVTFLILTLNSLKINKYLIVLSFLALVLIPGASLRYMIGPMFLAAFIFGISKNNTWLLMISGILLSLSIFLSIEVGIFSFIVLMIYLVSHYTFAKRIKTLLSTMINFSIGFLVSMLICLLIFATQGWVGHYMSTTFEFIFSLSGANLPNGYGLPNIFRESGAGSPIEVFRGLISRYSLFYISFILISSFISILLVKVIVYRKYVDTFFLLVSLYTFLIYLSIIGRSGHYFNVFPFVIFLGVYLGNDLVKHLKRNHKKSLSLFVLILITFFVVRHLIVFRFAAIDTIALYKESTTIERASPLRISKFQKVDVKTLTDFIFDNSSIDDSIYILNNSPGLYFLADRKNATRYDLPLLAGTLDKRLEIVSQLSQNSPKFIIEDLKAWDVDEVSDRRRMPEVFDYVELHYTYSTDVGKFRIYSKEPF